MRATDFGSRLTDRELQILEAIADGWSAKETARILGITPRTVECHIDAVRMKLRARNRTHAIAIALARELLPSRILHRAAA
ncbi:helix-turn-helix domain-containing protein [Novosphingobium sp. G106]|uniref:helix-turn-helix domain-containing protein n=1 Tax=Novosphingobium sp. G106 TaxID=2849500 RepID=UPI002811B12F|nr:helix-turn-helix domain-containing protein [Novosphingobium sp. G106]